MYGKTWAIPDDTRPVIGDIVYFLDRVENRNMMSELLYKRDDM